MDEVFGEENFVSLIPFKKTTCQTSDYLSGAMDYLLFYAKVKTALKYRQVFNTKDLGGLGGGEYQCVLDESGKERRLNADEFSGLAAVQGRVYASHPIDGNCQETDVRPGSSCRHL